MMRKTIFSKIMATYFLVILVTVSVVAWFQLVMVKNYLMSSKEKELLVRSEDLATVLEPILIKGDDPRPVVVTLNRADRILGTEFWVVNNKGKVMVASADHLYCEGNTLEAADLEQLKAGKVSIRSGQSQYFKEAVIRVASPIRHQKKLLGAVILYAPVTGVNAAYAQMKSIHIGAAILGIAVSVLLGLLISRYITRTVREVSRVAKSIAKGNFQERVPVRSSDELGQLGDSFNHMARHLEKYEHLRREFVANVSHELRSPLTSIQGFIEAMIEGKNKNPNETAKYLSIIQKETERMGKLVSELLEISRFDAEVIRFDMEPFPILNVIKRAITSLQPRISEKSIEIKINVQADLPECYGDEDRIEQVLHNLLDNAIRYSPQGKEIIVGARLMNENVLIQVVDKGPGIENQELSRIWERFYRVDKARSRDEGGTGLGLAIVQEIVEKHGGRVEVRSVEGEGANFSFTLPVAKL